MARFATRLMGKQLVAENTLEVALHKPDGMTFLAGQNLNIKLPELKYDDPKGPRRTFTISSSPQQDQLTITFRTTASGFKKTLAEMEEGTALEFIGPNGRFYLYKEVRKAVLIAGGIGITPFKSMIEDVVATGRSVELNLFYSNKTVASFAYHDLFLQLAEAGSIQYLPCLTGGQQDWHGLTERITFELIQKRVNQVREYDLFFCGPPDMVKNVQTMLLQNGIKEEKIHFESFWGY